MRASPFLRYATLLTLSALPLVLGASAAHAEETAAPKKNVTVVDGITVKGRHGPGVSVDIARLVPRAPLPELRKPLVDRIASAVEKDPF